MRILDKSRGKLVGYVVELPKQSTTHDDVYIFRLRVYRADYDEEFDEIVCHCDERDASKITRLDQYIKVTGWVSTYNENNKVHMFFSVEDVRTHPTGNCINEIEIAGTICKEPRFIKKSSNVGNMPLYICKLLVAVNFSRGQSAYIPIVFWGKNAKRVSKDFKCGDRIQLTGSYVSREYPKKNRQGVKEWFTTYEICGNSFKEA